VRNRRRLASAGARTGRRNTSGWIIAKTTDTGSRHTGCTLNGSAPGMQPTWNTVAEDGACCSRRPTGDNSATSCHYGTESNGEQRLRTHCGTVRLRDGRVIAGAVA